jgi:hypothetical protein
LKNARLAAEAGRQLTITKFAHKARVVTNALMIASIAALDVTAKRRGSTQGNCAHDATLRGAERGAMAFSIGVAVAAEHIRQLRPGAGHRPIQRSEGLRWRWFWRDGNGMREKLQQAGCRADLARRDAQIRGGGGEAPMTEQSRFIMHLG